jgi:hypothetical protein
MRKITWCLIPGIVSVVAGYRMWQAPGNRLDAIEDQPPVVACCDDESCATCSCGHSPCRLASPSQAPSDEALFPPRLTNVIDLPAATEPSASAIVIAEADPSPAPLPASDPNVEPMDRVAFVPPIMPYCDDDSNAPGTMPYADADLWNGSNTPASSEFFEDSEPATETETAPAAREDESLSRQYPGVPAQGSPTLPAKQGVKKPTPWQHDKTPILPVPPAPQGPAVPARDKDDDTGPQALRDLSGLLQHTVMKAFGGKETDGPARQPVDTLEVRPTDLQYDETVPEDF